MRGKNCISYTIADAIYVHSTQSNSMQVETLQRHVRVKERQMPSEGVTKKKLGRGENWEKEKNEFIISILHDGV